MTFRTPIAGNRYPSTDTMVLALQREGKRSEIEKDEVDFGEIEDSEVEKSGTKNNKAEKSDNFEDCN